MPETFTVMPAPISATGMGAGLDLMPAPITSTGMQPVVAVAGSRAWAFAQSRAARALDCAQKETNPHGWILDSSFAANILACAYSYWTQVPGKYGVIVRTAPPAYAAALGDAMLALYARLNRKLTWMEVAMLADEVVVRLTPAVTGRVPMGSVFEVAAPIGFDPVRLSMETQASVAGPFGGGARPFAGLRLPPAPGDRLPSPPTKFTTSGFPVPPMPGGYVPYGETDNYNNGYRLGQRDAQRAHVERGLIRMPEWVNTASPYYRFAYEVGVEMAGCWLQRIGPFGTLYVERAPWSPPGVWRSGRVLPGASASGGASASVGGPFSVSPLRAGPAPVLAAAVSEIDPCAGLRASPDLGVAALPGLVRRAVVSQALEVAFCTPYITMIPSLPPDDGGGGGGTPVPARFIFDPTAPASRAYALANQLDGCSQHVAAQEIRGALEKKILPAGWPAVNCPITLTSRQRPAPTSMRSASIGAPMPPGLMVNLQGPIGGFAPDFTLGSPPPSPPPPPGAPPAPLAQPVFAPPVMRDPFTAASIADSSYVKTGCLAYFDTATGTWIPNDALRPGSSVPVALYRRAGDHSPRASDGSQPQYAFQQGPKNPTTPPAPPPDVAISDATHPVTVIPIGSIVCPVSGSASVGAFFMKSLAAVPRASFDVALENQVAATLACLRTSRAYSDGEIGEPFYEEAKAIDYNDPAWAGNPTAHQYALAWCAYRAVVGQDPKLVYRTIGFLASNMAQVLAQRVSVAPPTDAEMATIVVGALRAMYATTVTPAGTGGGPGGAPPDTSPGSNFGSGYYLGLEDARRAKAGQVVWMARWISTAGPAYVEGYTVGVNRGGARIYATVGGYRILPGT